MTIHVNRQEAEQNISQLLNCVLQGEEAIVFVEGQEIARLVPTYSHPAVSEPRIPGIDKGHFTVPDDFEAPLPEEIVNAFLANDRAS
jgi:antitoxin (DNA-binding transcriptional repressor) of toxin-antitoxin stability system